MKYKKINLFLFFIIAFLFGTFSAFASCKPNPLEEIYYAQGDYADVEYCVDTTMLEAGCMPVSYAMVVANLSNSSVTPKTIRDEICYNSILKREIRDKKVASYMLGSSSAAKRVADKYNISITYYANQSDDVRMEDVKSRLKNGSMFIVSMKCSSSNCVIKTGSSGHYIVLANVTDDGKIVVLNPGRRATGQQPYTEEDIRKGVINHLNQGMWEVVNPTSKCANTNPSPSGEGNVSSDPDDIFPDLGVGDPSCHTLFVGSDGNLNEFGEFVQGLFSLIKIATPLLVVVLSTIDYIKAIASSNGDDLKKANKRTIQRLIIGLIVFFLPFLLDLLFHMFGLYDLSSCGIAG